MLAETVASWKNAWRAEGLAAGRAEGIAAGRAEGRLGNLTENIRALMESLSISREKAMDMLKVSEEDRAKLSSML